MYRYLNDLAADYITTTLDITSAVVIPQEGDKTQAVHVMDDGSVVVIGISSDSFFNIVLQWKTISDANHTILMDFFHNSAKGDARRRTFYWAHPIDGHIYTVRFMGPLTPDYNPIGRLSVQQMPLRVEGNKP